MSASYIAILFVACVFYFWSFVEVASGNPFDGFLLAVASTIILLQSEVIEEAKS